MTRSVLRFVTALLAACTVVAFHAPSGAAAGTDPMVTAMQRDLDLSRQQVAAWLNVDADADRLEAQLSRALGDTYAGTWLNPDHSDIVVGTTDPARLLPISVAGAEPEVVPHTAAALVATKRQLDKAPRPAADAVAFWYVDLPKNRVVVAALPDGAPDARAFVAESGANPAIVEVITTRHAPRLLYDVRGGDAYYPGNFRCSVGFSVVGGFVTAGHCGGAGTSVDGYNFIDMGVVEEATFPGDDYAWVSVNADWTPQPWVNDYSGGNVTVTGSQEAGVGAGVCRSGSTTGWRCGTILAKDVTVNYPQGVVYGLTQTSACAEPGDSGGSYLWGNQAQGVLSGGSGNCTSGGQTFFQPVNEILQAYGLTLVTG